MAIRYRDALTYGDGKLYVKANLTSSDDKPTTGIATGSIAIETDTGKSYVFDEDSAAWTELKSSGGGGGGGGANGFTLLKTVDLGHIQTSSTSATDTGITTEVDVKGYDLLVSVAVSNAEGNGYHKMSVVASTIYGSNRDNKNRNAAMLGGVVFQKISTGYQTASAPQGVWAIINSIADDIASIKVNMRYNSANTGTVNADYTLYLYGIDGVSLAGLI